MRALTATVVQGPDGFSALHAGELPQKDNLCGAFWAALALRAAGVDEIDGAPVDQDFVALRAGTTLPEGDPATFVPARAPSRQDYRLPIPYAAEAATSGTSAHGLARVIEDVSDAALAVVAVAGPWSGESVAGLVEEAAASAPRAVLVANLRTAPLWGSRPPVPTLLAHLAGAPVDPPPPEWDVGHFNNLVAVVRGAGGAFVLVRDTYPTLGWGGYHLQPPEALAAALVRGDGREGGVICICPAAEAEPLRRGLDDAGYDLRLWDNGTPDSATAAGGSRPAEVA